VQEVRGFAPLQAGLAFLPTTVMIFASAQAATRLLPRLGPKSLAVAGITVTIVGMLWLARVSTATTYVPGLLGPLLPFVTVTVLALSEVGPQDSGAASSLVNVTQQVGGSLGLAVLVTVFGTASRNGAAHPTPGASPQAQQILAHGIGSAFTAAAVFIACALILALIAVDTGRPEQPPAGGRSSA
jgi:hypothetical protein